MFNFEKFCRDRKITTAPPGHKHHRRGWTNIVCPFCHGSEGGYHLGFNQQDSFFVCYRCGWRPVDSVLSIITGLKISVLSRLIADYSLDRPLPHTVLQTPVIRPERLRMPSGVGPLKKIHIGYLESRNFDPFMLQTRWGLLGTGHVSFLDDIDYKFRIIAPINFNNSTVSFQGRDVTNFHPSKYKACPEEMEIIPHKHILYGLDLSNGRTCVIVEGITGVWRLGPGAVGTFGVKYLYPQARLLISRFQRIVILFDPDEAGIKAADSLWSELSLHGVEAEILSLPEGIDSGSLDQSEADYFMKNIT